MERQTRVEILWELYVAVDILLAGRKVTKELEPLDAVMKKHRAAFGTTVPRVVRKREASSAEATKE